MPHRVVHRYLRVPEATARRLEQRTQRSGSQFWIQTSPALDSKRTNYIRAKPSAAKNSPFMQSPGARQRVRRGDSSTTSTKPATFAGVADDSGKRMTRAEQPQKAGRPTDTRICSNGIYGTYPLGVHPVHDVHNHLAGSGTQTAADCVIRGQRRRRRRRLVGRSPRKPTHRRKKQRFRSHAGAAEELGTALRVGFGTTQAGRLLRLRRKR